MLGKIINQFKKSETYFLILVLLILVCILFKNPIKGIADNGDFNRALLPAIMGYDGKLSGNELYFNFVNKFYEVKTPLPLVIPVYLNTHVPVVVLAKTINCIFYSAEVFNIRFLSLIYSILMLWGMYLLFKGFKLKNLLLNILMFSILILVCLDRGNILYFNSLYAEPMAFVCFLLSAGYLVRIIQSDKPLKRHIVLFYMFLIGFLGSKAQYNLLSVLFIPLTYYMAKSIRDNQLKCTAWIMTAIMVTVNLSVYSAQPKYLDDVTTFSSVFMGIVKDTDTETGLKYLDELGIPREYIALAGMDGFKKEYPIDINSDEFREKFYNRMSKGKIVVFYLKHIDVLIENMNNTARVAFMNLPEYLGNYSKEYLPVRTSFKGFSLYDSFKKSIFPHNFLFIFGFYALYLLALIYRFIKVKERNRRIWYLFIMILILFSCIQFVLPTVGNGGADIAKQLYMFNVIFDFLLIYIVYFILHKFCLKVFKKGAKF